MSREVKEIKTLDDLRYKADHNLLTEDERAEYDDEDIQKLLRGEKVKFKGLGKQGYDDGEDEGDQYDGMSKKELTAELASRVDENGDPLSTSGTNKEMAERLRENDAANA